MELDHLNGARDRFARLAALARSGKPVIEMRIYVGLDDKDSHEQRWDTEKCKALMKEVCRTYDTPFSLHLIEGGYFHDDGTWVEENTLVVTLIGTPSRTVYQIAKEVCTLFNQETVLLTCTPVHCFSVHDDSPELGEDGPAARGEKGEQP